MLFVALVVSCLFAWLHFKGYYGYGSDFIHTYQYINDPKGRYTDYFGSYVVGLGDGKHPYSIFLVSLFLIFSASLMLKLRLQALQKVSWLTYVVGIILIAHIWPIFMSFSNVMRQGVLMFFLYMALYFLSTGKKKYFVIMLLPLAFSHKSSPFYLVILSLLYLAPKFKFKYDIQQKNLIIFLGLFLFLILFSMYSIFIGDRGPSRVIGGDFSNIMWVLSMLWLASYYFSTRNYSVIANFLALYTIIISVFYFKGLIWEYERLIMVVLLLYILWAPIPKFMYRYWRAYIVIALASLVFVTWYIGLFASYQPLESF